MPILVECPACGTKLSAPDSGAGKKVRCPKVGCGTLVPVPMPFEEAPVDAELVPPPKPARVKAAAVEDEDRPRKRGRDDDEDERPRHKRRRDEDDDDEDDRPRRRRGAARGRSGTSTGKVVAFVVGGLLLLGGLGAGVYFLAFGKSSPPSGWTEYTYPEAGFKAYFPREPIQRSGESLGLLGELGGVGITYTFNAHSTENGSAFTATVESRPLPTHVPPDKAREIVNKLSEDMEKSPPSGMRLIEARTVTWMGHKVRELRFGMPENARRDKDMVIIHRVVVTDTHQFIGGISTEDGRKLSSRTINGFFDNIQPLK